MTARKGVNLGGWLVAEKWMTPALFEGTRARDEFGLHADRDEPMCARLSRHRKEFITKRDIMAIKRAGFEFVRVPVGYWLWLPTDGYLEDSQIVDKLLQWCKEANLGVLLSLHGAPGSQSGWDHTGQIGPIRWHEPENVQRTLEVITILAKRYGNHPALIGVGLLNEPHPSIPLETLIDYYRQATTLVRKYANPSVDVILSDGFRPHEMAQAMHDVIFRNCILDVHLYQVFDDADRQLTFDQHIAKVEAEWGGLIKVLGSTVRMLVGEWSAMLAAETFAGLSDATRRGMVRRYYDIQRTTFADAWGWAYWSYKTGGESVWNWSEHNEHLLQ